MRAYLKTFAFGALAMGWVGCQTAAPIVESTGVADGPLLLVHADAIQGVAAIWDDGVVRLELKAQTDAQGIVHSTITDHGRVVTRMDVPLASAADLAADIGPLARNLSLDKALVASDQTARDHLLQLLPIYARALDSLYRMTEELGGSSLRMALVWHEEVLGRLVVGGVVADSDADAACPDRGLPAHTNLVHRPELTSLLQNMSLASGGGKASGAEPLCNLNCAWYDACCQHDQACVYCNHWWCGWSCVPGCFGGGCGGGH